MTDQVLSVEQMKELIDMGIHTSGASCYWLVDHGFGTKWVLPKSENVIMKTPEDTPDEFRIDAFTLQDILERLPIITKTKSDCDGEEYRVSYGPDMHISGRWSASVTYDFGDYSITFDGTPLEAAFKMLKWCKENNHI